MDGLILELKSMAVEDSPRMKREHAKLLLVTLYGAILSLVNGGTDLIAISLACKLFENFHYPRVEEAAVLGLRKSTALDDYVSSLYQRFGEDAVLEATELEEEKAHAYGWMLCLRAAFKKVAKCDPPQRTPETVRQVFLDRVYSTNEFSAENYPKDTLHKLDELEATYRALVRG